MLVSTRWLTSQGLRAIIICMPVSILGWLLLTSTFPSAPLDTRPSGILDKLPFQGGRRPIAKANDNPFIQDLLDNDLNLRFVGTALTEVCKSKRWRSGLIFSCDPAEGGIGNIRNIILNCVRYAIEAGATQLILPTLVPLQKNARVKPDPVPLSHFFDINHFKTTLRSSCPQISFLPDLNALWDKPSTSPAISLLPEELDIDTVEKRIFHQIAYLKSPSTWATSLTAHIREVHPDPYSAAAPILVALQPPLLLQWPLTYETPAFIENFGLLLKFNPEIRHLAASIIYGLDKVHKLQYNPRYDPGAIQPNLFYGAHLRTGPDAISAGWTPYKVQSQNYLWDALKVKASLIYVASDDKEDTWLFAQEANDKGIKVTNALQALAAPELRGELMAEHELFEAWDSGLKSCVDWIVLSRASHMGGTWESSFSWGIAMTRHRGLLQPRWGLKPGITPAKDEHSHDISPHPATASRKTNDQLAGRQAARPEVIVRRNQAVDEAVAEANRDSTMNKAKIGEDKPVIPKFDAAKEKEFENELIKDISQLDSSPPHETEAATKVTDSKADIESIPDSDDREQGDSTTDPEAEVATTAPVSSIATHEAHVDVAVNGNSGDHKSPVQKLHTAEKQETATPRLGKTEDYKAPPKHAQSAQKGYADSPPHAEKVEDYKPPPKKAQNAQKIAVEAPPPKADEKKAAEIDPVVSESITKGELADPKWVKQAFGDGLTTVYGPEDEGEMFWGAMWP